MRTTAFSIVFVSSVLACCTSVLARSAEQGEGTALLASAWSSFARTLPCGSRVRVVLKDGRKLSGSLVGASESAVVLKPPGRLPEADITVQTETISSLRRDGGYTRGLIPTPGERVRVITHDSRAPLIGTLTSFDPGNLSIFLEGQRGVVRLERSQLKSLEISGGNKSLGRRIKKGGLLGFAAGMAWGFAYSLIESPCWSEPGRCEQGPLSGVFFGTLISGITVPVGIGIGAAVPSEKWREVDRTQLAVTLVPQKGGTALALRLRF